MPHPARRHGATRRSRAVAALVAVVVAGLAGCTAPQSAPERTQEANPDASSAPTPDLAAFYGQTLKWHDCDEGECSSVKVPLDYADPEGTTIRLALARQRATGDDRIGALLVNPGGPGVSGVDFLPSALDAVSKSVQARYDVVGFDPRGVQHSEPAIACYDGPELDALLAADYDWSTDEGVQEAIDSYGDFGRECLARTGDLLAHVDTISAARDLDVLRAALGDSELHFLGYSYGSELGATYASLFPEQVGRLVLDGAVDPTITPEDSGYQQAVGFENALRAYVTDCQAGADCPLTGDLEEGLSQVRRLLDRAKVSPLPTGTDRELTQSLAFTGIAMTLYSRSFWTYLTSALRAAIEDNDGSILLVLADAYNYRQEDGSYANNLMQAFPAISCVDGRASANLDDMRRQTERIVEAAPTVGEMFSYGGVGCAQWPVPVVGGLDDYSAAGAAPILVVGTTNDPATPYLQAEALAKILESGTLLTFEGEGHTAYGSSNDCIADAVDAYLLDGVVPDEGTRC